MIARAARKLGIEVSGVDWPAIDNTRRTRWSLSAFGIVLLIVFWQAVTAVFALNPKYYPSPIDAWDELARIWSPIVEVLPNTLLAAGIGYLLALTLSIAAAALLVANERLLQAFMPFIIGLNTVPRIALTPLVIFWVSVFIDPTALALANPIMALWVAFFPMLIAALDGFRNLDEATENMLDVYGATTWQEFKYVRFKNGLPFIFDGMKIGFILAMIGAVVGEFVSGTEGIGSQAFSAIGRTSISRAFAIVLVLGFISTGIVLAIYLIESRVIHWRDSSIMGEG